jgi:hypothetical protein
MKFVVALTLLFSSAAAFNTSLVAKKPATKVAPKVPVSS